MEYRDNFSKWSLVRKVLKGDSYFLLLRKTNPGHRLLLFSSNRKPFFVSEASPEPFQGTEPERGQPQHAEDHLETKNSHGRHQRLERTEGFIQSYSFRGEQEQANRALHNIIGQSHFSHMSQRFQEEFKLCVVPNPSQKPEVEKSHDDI